MCEFTVGCAVFRDEMGQSQRRLLTREVLSIIERQDQWWLCFGIYKQNWSTLFALMRETRVLKLELGRNEHSRMITEIRGVGFPMLRALCFGKNRIISLQGLQHINAPCLEWLSFEENHLTDLRSFRKASFPRLKVLNLKTNRIREVDLRAVHAPSLSKLTLEAFHTDSVQAESLIWAFTLQTAHLEILRCRSGHRIAVPPLQEALRKKYPRLNLKRFDPNNAGEEDNSESDHE